MISSGGYFDILSWSDVWTGHMHAWGLEPCKGGDPLTACLILVSPSTGLSKREKEKDSLDSSFLRLRFSQHQHRGGPLANNYQLCDHLHGSSHLPPHHNKASEHYLQLPKTARWLMSWWGIACSVHPWHTILSSFIIGKIPCEVE